MFDKRNADFHDLSKRLLFDSGIVADESVPGGGNGYGPATIQLRVFDTDALFWLVSFSTNAVLRVLFLEDAEVTLPVCARIGRYAAVQPGVSLPGSYACYLIFTDLNYRLMLQDADIRALLASEELQEENIRTLRRFDQVRPVLRLACFTELMLVFACHQ